MTVLLEWLIEGVAVAGVAATALRLIPTRYAAQRHLFLWLSLLCVTALPIASELSAPASSLHDGGSLPSTPIPAVVLPVVPDWAVLSMLIAWGITVLVGLVRLLHGLSLIGALAKRAEPLPPTLGAAMGLLAQVRRTSRPADILVSSAIDGACAIGYLRPHVVLSRSLVQRLEPSELEAIALHEYAHLQRFDDWTRLAQRLLVILFGLHPAVRWISRRIDIECEAACDRRAVEHLAGPARYARALAKAGALSGGPRHDIPALAPAALRHRAGLHARVVRVLEHTWVSRRLANGVAIAAALTVVGIVGIAAAWPPLIVTAAIEQSVAQLVSEPPDPSASGMTLPGIPVPPSRGVRDDVRPKARTGAARLVDAAVDSSDPGAESPALPTATLIAEDQGTVFDSTADAAPLASVALPQVVVHAEPASSTPAPTPVVDAAPGWSAVGAGAAHAGVNTGAAMSRAGGSIGRVFKRGSLAIARSF